METKHPHLYEVSEMILSIFMAENQRMKLCLTTGQKQQAYTIQFGGGGWKAGNYIDLFHNQRNTESS